MNISQKKKKETQGENCDLIAFAEGAIARISKGKGQMSREFDIDVWGRLGGQRLIFESSSGVGRQKTPGDTVIGLKRVN